MNNPKVEPIVRLLFAGMVFFTAALFACVHFFSDDGQLFQVISGLLTGFSGAFFMRIKPRNDVQAAPGPTLVPSPPDQTVTATLNTPGVPEPVDK